MTEEENILKMVVEKESWEEIIYYIVNVENLDPWNVDLVKLTNRFLNFIKSTKDLDFRIPAKIVFVATVLLRLKADNLSIFAEKETAIEEVLREQKPFEQLGIDPNLVQLGYPMKRIPKRQVTLDELMVALRKALVVHDKKEVRRKLWKAELQEGIAMGEDITVRIERLMKNIDEVLEKLHKDKIEFKEIVKDWKRDKVIDNFVPLLHLEQGEKIKTEQEDFFKEILISKRTV